jgi:type VI secretion system protein VasJ
MIPLDPAWRNLGSTPIPGGEPLGSDPTDDLGFESIENEIDKLQTDPAGVDWEEVVKSGAQVLGTRGKDWRVGCRMAVALHHLYGFPGLAAGLSILRDLIDEERWEKIYPPARRAKMRGAFLDWLSERLTTGLEKSEEEPAAEDAEALADAVASLSEIDSRLSAALGDHAPILNRLADMLDQHYAGAKARAAEQAAAAPAPGEPAAETEPAAEPGPAADAQPAAPAVEPAGEAPAPASTPQPQAAPPPPAAPLPSVQPGADVSKTLREIKNALLATAAVLRQAKASDPRSYVMLRTAIWLDLERLPPNQNGVTGIPEPSPDRRKHFEQLQQQGDWGNLINEVEKSLGAGSIFWLDAHRLVANALEELGPAYLEARRGVIESLGLLLRRFPGVEKLKFQQGSGFADDLTLSWIGSEVLAVGPAGGGGGGGGEQAPWVEAAAKAEALAVKGKVQEGLALFREGIGKAGSLRERFCWELAQARGCADAGYRDIAAMQTRHLANIVDQYQLDQWEPALAVDLARLYVSVHERPPAGAAEGEENQVYTRMLTRLARYDVSAVFDVKPGAA